MQIAEQIREAICDGTFKSGEQLPTELEMAEQFGVSRPTIREALKRLAAQNLITSRRGPTGGTFVRHYDVEDASESILSATMLMMSLKSVKYCDILDVRRSLEFVCCQKAMKKWSPDLEVKIRTVLNNLKKPDISDSEFKSEKINFHRLIVDASGNPMLQFLMYGVMEAPAQIAPFSIEHPDYRETVLTNYERLLDAMVSKNEDDAKTAIDIHLDYLKEISNR